MTTPGCPVSESLPEEARGAVQHAAGDCLPVSVRVVWDPPWDPSMMDDTAWLGGLLSAALRRIQDPRQAGRQEGHRRAAEMAGPGDLADLLEQEISRRGFRPARADRGQMIEFTLGRCPFAEVAAADPDTICLLHLGLAERLTEGLGGLTTERLTVRTARRAGCRLTVRRAAAEPRILA